MHIYAVIIGTEILNGRRNDKHFTFLRDALLEYGYELYASFIIKDDPILIENIYTMIKNDPNSIMFSFGGIGSTPDDLTREIASKVFRQSKVKRNETFFKAIIEKFGKEAYPHRIHMAELPPDSQLLPNPVNNMSGFALDNRFFFMPGFPQMSHPMVETVLKDFLGKNKAKHRLTLKAKTSENELIHLMQQTPKEIELSSLPILNDTTKEVELSLSGENEKLIQTEFQRYLDFLKQKNIEFEILKIK